MCTTKQCKNGTLFFVCKHIECCTTRRFTRISYTTFTISISGKVGFQLSSVARHKRFTTFQGSLVTDTVGYTAYVCQ